MATLGAKPLCGEPKVYFFLERNLHTSYADDILTVGPQDSTDWFYGEVSQLLPIKHLGELLPWRGRAGPSPLTRRQGHSLASSEAATPGAIRDTSDAVSPPWPAPHWQRAATIELLRR